MLLIYIWILYRNYTHTLNYRNFGNVQLSLVTIVLPGSLLHYTRWAQIKCMYFSQNTKVGNQLSSSEVAGNILEFDLNSLGFGNPYQGRLISPTNDQFVSFVYSENTQFNNLTWLHISTWCTDTLDRSSSILLIVLENKWTSTSSLSDSELHSCSEWL